MRAPDSRVARASALLAKLEDGVLALLLVSLIGLATTQIVLRNVLDTSWLWIGPSLRYLVLWLGLLGALSAARTGEHIAIDALARVLSPLQRGIVALLTGGFTLAVCSILAYHGARLVALDRESGSLAFGDMPTWPFICGIPLCFAGMALRYVSRIAQDLQRLAELRSRP